MGVSSKKFTTFFIMKLLAYFVPIMALAFTAQADIAVFKSTTTNKLIGVGGTSKLVGSAHLIIDVDDGSQVTVAWFTRNGQKFFSVTADQSYIGVVTGAAGVRQMVMGYSAMGFDGNGNYYVRQGYGRGKSGRIAIRPTRSIEFAPTMNGTSRVIQEGPNGTVTGEGSGVMRFQKVLTQDANARGDSAASMAARIANSLRAQGYTEIVVP